MTGRAPASDAAARPWAILAVLCMAGFVTQLDVTVLAIALPRIRADFGASTEQVVWVLSAYILVLAVFLVTAGRLGDLFGRRRVFLAGLAVFTAASAAAAMASGMHQLIAARAGQGLGAALLTPQTLALLVDAFPAGRRGLALGIRGAVTGVAAITGPVLGGALTTALHWRWVFYVNIPLGLSTLLVGWTVLPADGHRRRHPLDVTGVVLAATTLLGAAFVINRSDPADWSASASVALAASLAGAVAFVLQQRTRQRAEPLVPFTLFRRRNFTLMIAYAMTTSSIVIGLVLVLSLYFQSSLALDPLQAGLLILPASLASTLADPLVGRLADRLDGRHLLVAGAVLTAAGMLWTAAGMRTGTGWAAFIAPMVVIGVGNATLFTPLAVVALGGVGSDLAGAASGILATALQIGSMLGAAVTGAILHGAVTTAVAADRTAMVVLAGIAAAGGVIGLGVRRETGTEPLAPNSTITEPARQE